MKENYTHLTIVLDRSGSMGAIRDDTIGSFNEFIEKQKEKEGECTLSLIQFNHSYETIYDFVKLKDVPDLNKKTFQPGGTTALLDAIGSTINSTGVRLEKMNENDRPERNIFVILTDGEENSSKEYIMNAITDMIQHQTDKYNWQFVFLAANQDAIASASKMGIKKGNSLSIAATKQGMGQTMCTLDAAVTSYRGMSASAYANASDDVDAFSEEDRKKQEDAGALKSSV